MTREPGDVLRVGCVKSRTAKEPNAFLFSLRDNETTESTFLHFETELRGAQEGQKSEDQGMTLISQFYDKATDGVVTTKDIISHLKGKGISERTAQRWHRGFVALWAEKVRRGVYRKRDKGAKAA